MNIQEAFDEIKKSKDICDALTLYLDSAVARLKNPDLWEKFEDGKGKVEAAKIIQKLSNQFKKTDNPIIKRTDYR